MLSADSVWPPRIAALVLSGAAALSAAYWGLHWQVSPHSALAATAGSADMQAVDGEAVARALGAAAAASTEAPAIALQATETSRFVLQGVLGNAGAGSALIAVDGMQPKPVRLGGLVADGWTLRLVEGRRAVLSRNGTDLELSLPALPVPATLVHKSP